MSELPPDSRETFSWQAYPRSELGPYEPNPAYQRFPGPPPTRTMAGWSLGLAIFPSVITWILAVVFACIVISRSKDGRPHGKRMAVGALVIVGVWIAVAVVVIVVVLAVGAHRDGTGRVTDAGRSSVLDLRVGDCLPDELNGLNRTVTLVPCSQPHHAEVYAVFDLSGDYSTHQQVKTTADAGCADRFQNYVGVAIERSSLQVFDLVPPDAATFGKNPSITCILVSEDSLTRTLAHSAR